MSRGCRYDEAGPWNDGANCASGMKPGSDSLGRALVDRWGGFYQGFSCRPNTGAPSQMSVHGTGRAVDYFPPSREAGDEAAAALVADHEELGIQLTIWWRRDWSCDQGWTAYGGPNPHTDHLHIEQDAVSAERVLHDPFNTEDITMDKQTRAYFDAKFAAGRERDLRAAKRAAEDRVLATERHRKVLLAIGDLDDDVAEVDQELTVARQRLKRIEDAMTAEGFDPAEDDEFDPVSPPASENG